jgi:hypothetical protein
MTGTGLSFRRFSGAGSEERSQEEPKGAARRGGGDGERVGGVLKGDTEDDGHEAGANFV